MATKPVGPSNPVKLTVVSGGKFAKRGGGAKFFGKLAEAAATRKAADLLMKQIDATPKGHPVLLGTVKGLRMPTEHQYVDKTHAARDMAMWAMVLGIDPKRNA